MLCPLCGQEPYYTENIIGTLTYIYCLGCNKKTPVHPPEKVKPNEWDLIDGNLFKKQIREIERWEKERPVLAALARNSR